MVRRRGMFLLGSLILASMAWAQTQPAAPSTRAAVVKDPDVIVVGKWSEEIEGIRGRILLKNDGERQQTVPYLELRHSSAGNPHDIYIDVSKVKWEMRDDHDKAVPQAPRTGGGGGAGPPAPAWTTLEFDCTLQTRLTAAGWGFSHAPLAANDPASVWDIRPADAGDYFLHATFSSAPSDETGHANVWKKSMDLPAIKIRLPVKK